jgi:hypothetical protein
MFVERSVANAVENPPPRSLASAIDESMVADFAAVQSYLNPLRAFLSDEVTEVAVNKPGKSGRKAAQVGCGMTCES